MDTQSTEALCARPHPWATPRLSAARKRLIPDFLSHGAEAYSLRGEGWTCARVAKVIENEFGVVYHQAQVSRLLKKLDWTPQKPIRRATQRDEAEIELWRTEKLGPHLKKASQKRRSLVFVDESGFYLWPGVVRTYAPCGQPPILRLVETHYHLAVMNGITPAGDMFTLTQDESLLPIYSWAGPNTAPQNGRHPLRN